jgi:membrane protein implicated in regulation of membrane protease activity
MSHDEKTQLIVWGVLTLLLLGAEMVSFAFVAVYFALGALAAAGVVLLGGNLVVQVVVFLAVSVVAMWATRGLVMRNVSPPMTPSNAHTVVGKRGIVTIEIDNDASTGQVRVGTEYWTARRAGDGGSVPPIGINEKVEVVSVQGVTAQVLPIGDAAEASSSAAVTPPE